MQPQPVSESKPSDFEKALRSRTFNDNDGAWSLCISDSGVAASELSAAAEDVLR